MPETPNTPATFPAPVPPPAPPELPDGLIETQLVRFFGRSYRTTLAGIVALLATVAPFVPGIPSSVVDVLHAIAGAAMGAGLLIAKDSRVSGRP